MDAKPLPGKETGIRSISGRLAIGLTTAVGLISAIAILALYLGAIREEEAKLMRTADASRDFLVGALELPLSKNDKPTAEAICKTLAQNEIVVGLVIKDASGSTIHAAGKEREPDGLERIGKIFHQGKYLGEVDLSFTRRLVKEAARGLLFSYAMTMLFVLSALAFLTQLFIRKFVKEPIGKKSARQLALLSFALDHVNELASLVDEKGRFLYVNEESQRVLGYSATEQLGMTLMDVSRGWTEERWRRHWSELREKGSLSVEDEFLRKDGRSFPVDISANYFEYEGIGYNIALARDISERKEAERERLINLRFFESMDRINRAIQGSNDLEQMMSGVLDAVLAIFDCDRSFLMYPCDPEAASWRVPMECNKPEYPGAHAQRLELPMDADVAGTLRVLLASDRPVKFGPEADHPVPEKTAQRFGFRSFMSIAIYPKMGKPWQFGIHQCSFARVWTPDEESLLRAIGRRLADALSSLLSHRDLEESEAKYRRIVDTSAEGIWAIGPELATTFVNARMANMLGYSSEEMIGRPVTDFMFGDGATDFLEKLGGRREHLHESYECRVRRKDGQEVWTQVSAAPIFDDKQCFQGSFAMLTDITVRRHAEERLRRSERGLAEAQRIACLGSWELDLEAGLLTWSDEIYRIFEIDPEKFGASYEAFLNAIHPEDREMVNKAYTDSVRDRKPYDIVHRLQMPDGRIKYVNEKCETNYSDDGKPLRSIGTVHSITERKLAEQALQRLNRELHAISNCNQVLVRAEDEQTLLDSICRIICDEAGYRMAWVGYAEHDPAKTLRPVAWSGAEEGYLAASPWTWADTGWGLGHSGTAVRIGHSVCVQDFTTEPTVAPWRESALRQGYHSGIALPLKDESANTFGVLNIFAAESDAFTPDEIRLLEELAGDLAFGITVLRARIEHKRAEDEIKALNRELDQRVVARTAELDAANKELEAFSYSVSHDLRMPLRAIDGFSLILLDEYADKLDEEAKRLLKVVRDNTIRMAQLIDDILHFSRTGRVALSVSEIDMEGLARAVFDDLKPAIGNDRLRLEIAPLPHASGDAAMLRQVFANLLSNAVKFSRPKDQPRIEVCGSMQGQEAVYSVKDNGVGFDMQYAHKLFGVFQRLHGVTEFDGTGIGLAIVKRIVTRHGGRVWAEGKVDQGATFYFALPVKEQAHG